MKRPTLSVDDEIHKKVKEICFKFDISYNKYVNMLIKNSLELDDAEIEVLIKKFKEE